MVVEVNIYENGAIIEWKWASDNQLIPSPFYTSCYFIDGILIDSGPPAGVNDLRKFIRLISKKDEVKMCVITHTHEDHSGGAFFLQKKLKIPIYASKDAIPILKEESIYPQYRQIAWGEKRESVNAIPLLNNAINTNQGYKFDILPMPGHAPELITLIEKSQEWVFASDAIQLKYRMLFGYNSDIQEDISQIYNSINFLYDFTRGMDEAKIFISGQGVHKRKLLKEKLEEIKDLHNKVHNIYSRISKEYQNEMTVLKKVLRAVIGRETIIGKLTNGDLSSMNLMRELIKWKM